jgi:hypothetical protein
MIKYSDKDNFNTPINNLDGTKFNAYCKSPNYMTFTNNAFIKLSDESQYLSQDIRKITFWMDLNNATAAYRSIINNFFPLLGTAGNMLQTEGTDQLIFYYNNKFIRWKHSCLAYKGYLNFYEFTYDTEADKIHLKVNGNYLAPYQGPLSASQNITRTYLGTRYINGIGYFHQGALSDIRCYDANDNLLHHFPLNDNTTTVRDAVTNNTYTIYNYTSSVWANCSADDDIYNLDITHGIPNVAEFKNVDFPHNLQLNFAKDLPTKTSNPNLGADIDSGWNVTSQLTSCVTKGKYIAGPSVLYLCNHDANDLPEGCDYGIDLKTNYHVGYNHSYYFLRAEEVNPRKLQIKYWDKWGDGVKARVKFWYKKNPNSTSTNLQVSFGFGYCYIQFSCRAATNWTLYDQEIFIPGNGTPLSNVGADSSMFSISAHGGNTGDTYIASFAGLEVELLTPFDLTYPVYGEFDDKGNPKNIAIYNKKQLNSDNYKRLENKFKF